MIMTAVSATLLLSSPWMLGFLAVLAVPWLIAVRARPATQQIGLATTVFVLMAARQQSRWRRSTRWLVPLLRSLLVAAVVIAAAGPRWQPSDEHAPVSRHRVAIIDGSPTGQASAAVAAAIESLAEPTGMLDDTWQLDRVAPRDAAADGLPDDTGLVVLADGAHLSTPLQHRLTNWIVHGGRLLVLLGPADTLPDNQEVATWLNALAGVQVGGHRRTAGDTLHIPSTRPGGPQRIAGPFVRTHAVLNLQDRSGAGHTLTAPRVLLATEQGEPLLLTRGVGLGCVAISAIPWSVAAADLPPDEQPWSDLPAWPVFPAVVEDLLASFAATASSPPPVFHDGRRGWWQDMNLSEVFLVLALCLAAAEAIAVQGTGQGRAEQ